jgi:hypothetical protein
MSINYKNGTKSNKMNLNYLQKKNVWKGTNLVHGTSQASTTEEHLNNELLNPQKH